MVPLSYVKVINERSLFMLYLSSFHLNNIFILYLDHTLFWTSDLKI